MQDYVLRLDQVGMSDVEKVGGKNASLGEMISQLSTAGIKVPGGYATTAQAFRDFLNAGNLKNKIDDLLSSLDTDDVVALAETGKQIRQWILDSQLQPDLNAAIDHAYQEMASGDETMAFAVRSSATAEDLPEASFAGQQETFLNIRGLANIKQAIKEVFASLYNDRAISYRVHHNFEHNEVALSAGIQRMVRSETAASGVMFTMDTESGFNHVVFITAAYGLGETVVQGAVNPDEFYVYKPTLKQDAPAILRRTLGSKAIKMVYQEEGSTKNAVSTVKVPDAQRNRFCINDNDVQALAKIAVVIEQHYGRPMDIEWAKDGDDGELYVVQARPETVRSRDNSNVIERYLLKE
ncbi:PEP/pyruvate-binding domain-containing protein, partial [Neptunomonas phycophila]|uniref:PEP/pyruvate-binding domain-containing protein n=1 Tax=Neptunomonas phycophila TaxID=1572645 RepID=UPI0023F8B786